MLTGISSAIPARRLITLLSHVSLMLTDNMKENVDDYLQRNHLVKYNDHVLVSVVYCSTTAYSTADHCYVCVDASFVFTS